MRAGSLRHEITIEQVTHSLNEFRTPVEVWQPLFTLRAALLESDLSELAASGGSADEETTLFHCRYAEVTPAMRLQFRGEIYNIKKVRPMRNEREMEITAQKIGGDDEGA